MSVKDEVADTIGLTGYAVEADGIGGVLKSRITDFRVDDISTKISLEPRGRFTAANITLTNWETKRFIGKLARLVEYPGTESSSQVQKTNEQYQSKSSLSTPRKTKSQKSRFLMWK